VSLKEIKKLFESLGLSGNLVNIGSVALGATFLPDFTTSPTLHAYIRIAVVIGGLLGPYLYLTKYGGRGRDICVKARRRLVWIAILPLCLFVFMILLTEGQLARHVSSLISARDFFLDLPVLSNLVIALAIGFGVFLLMGALVLSWPGVWDTVPRIAPAPPQP
jgi:DMSO reductase anchor subunit